MRRHIIWCVILLVYCYPIKSKLTSRIYKLGGTFFFCMKDREHDHFMFIVVLLTVKKKCIPQTKKKINVFKITDNRP